MEVAFLIGCGLIGGGGFMYGLLCRRELQRWSNLFKTARIAIAYNGRVRLQAPLVEWALWCKRLEGRKEHGQVILKMNKMSVSIIKALPPEKKQRRFVTRDNRDKTGKPPLRAIEGGWSAKDETVA